MVLIQHMSWLSFHLKTECIFQVSVSSELHPLSSPFISFLFTCFSDDITFQTFYYSGYFFSLENLQFEYLLEHIETIFFTFLGTIVLLIQPKIALVFSVVIFQHEFILVFPILCFPAEFFLFFFNPSASLYIFFPLNIMMVLAHLFILLKSCSFCSCPSLG